MSKSRNKAVALMAAVAMAASMLVGCGSVKNDEIVATVGESKITAGVANFYARYESSSLEEYYKQYFSQMYSQYGYTDYEMPDKEIWEQKMSEDGKTLEEQTKESIMETLQRWYLLKNHAKEYKVSLTEKENEAIAKTVKAFMKANKKDAKEAVSGEEQYIKEVLELMTIGEKMYDAMVADVDTKVEDAEAAQKAMQYVTFPLSTTQEDGTTKELTKDEIKKLKTDAESFLAGAKEVVDFDAYAKEKQYTATAVTFDKETTTPDEKLIKAADKLKEGEFTELIETDHAYYVAKLTSLLDREATDKKKEEIVQERKDETYQNLLEEWKEDIEIKVNKFVWNKISFDDLKITGKSEKKEESKDSTSTGTTESTTATGGADKVESTETTEGTQTIE